LFLNWLVEQESVLSQGNRAMQPVLPRELPRLFSAFVFILLLSFVVIQKIFYFTR